MTGRELKPQDRTVDVTIRRIRKHFEDHPNTPNIIMTIHGEGYRFVEILNKVIFLQKNSFLKFISCFVRIRTLFNI